MQSDVRDKIENIVGDFINCKTTWTTMVDRLANLTHGPILPALSEIRLYGLDVGQIKHAIDIADLYQPYWRAEYEKGK